MNATAETGSQVGEAMAPLRLWQFVSYGLLTMPIAMAGLVFLTYLPTFYAVDMGLGLAAVGAVVVAGRLLDVVTDPLIGFLSDRTRSRFGPRKPWMAAGIAGFCASVWFLMIPPDNVSIWYLGIMGGAYFLFLTVLDVPYSSVGLELSPDPAERTKLASWKAVFQIAGAILAGFFPFVLASAIGDALPTIAATTIALAAIGFLIFIWLIPVPHKHAVRETMTLSKTIRTITGNERYRFLIGSFAVVQMGNAFFAALAVLFITHIVGAEQLVGLLIGLMFLATAVFLPLWYWISVRWGKLSAWKIAMITSCLAFACAPFIGSGNVAGAALLFVIIGGTFAADAIMPTSILADISYENEVQNNQRQAGSLLAIKNAASKFAFVAPMALAFPVLGMLNFETATQPSATASWIFLFFFSGIPIMLKLLALRILRSAPPLDAVTDTLSRTD